MDRDQATDYSEEIFEKCISPFLSDLGSLEAQLALEKTVRKIMLAEREACAKIAENYSQGYFSQMEGMGGSDFEKLDFAAASSQHIGDAIRGRK